MTNIEIQVRYGEKIGLFGYYLSREPSPSELVFSPNGQVFYNEPNFINDVLSQTDQIRINTCNDSLLENLIIHNELIRNMWKDFVASPSRELIEQIDAEYRKIKNLIYGLMGFNI